MFYRFARTRACVLVCSVLGSGCQEKTPEFVAQAAQFEIGSAGTAGYSSFAGSAGEGGIGTARRWDATPVFAVQPSDLHGGDYFGVSMALDGDVMVVGAPTQDQGARDCGAVYVYQVQGGQWSAKQRLAPSACQEGLLFGTSVALSGDTLAVGATASSSATAPATVHIWRHDGVDWKEQQILVPAGTRPEFGRVVAIHADALLVGSTLGAVGYERSPETQSWTESWATQRGRTTAPSDALALSSDYAAISSNGKVAVWRRTAEGWTFDQSIAEQGATGFGSAVALDGTTLAIGIPGTIGALAERGSSDEIPGRVAIFKRDENGWLRIAEITSAPPSSGFGEFGGSLALVDPVMAVGAPTAGLVAAGEAYLFERASSGWEQRLAIQHSSTSNLDRFGTMVGLSARRVAVTSPMSKIETTGEAAAGAAYVFNFGVARGEPCSSGALCRSGHCADDVCCETECSDLCMACRGDLRGEGKDGECGPILGGLDPDRECEAMPPETCGTTGTCNGSAGCAVYPRGSPCGGATCTSQTTATTMPTCDGVGKCVPGTSGECPNGLLCRGHSCLPGCLNNADCQPGHYCPDGTCAQQLGLGSICGGPTACSSGFCEDGVCCDRACPGPCESCSATTGKCEVVASGQPGRGLCNGYLCDGEADCPIACTRSAHCALGYFCTTGNSCAPQRELGASCEPTSDCADSEDCRVCRSQLICADRHCCDDSYPCRELGQSCDRDEDCASNHCADGVCCNEACSGLCEACDGAESAGYCRPIQGQPRSSRGGCPEGGIDEPCQQRICDGESVDTCSGYVSQDVECIAARCSNGVVQPRSVCDGKGKCDIQAEIRCAPYVCQGVHCVEECQTNDQCSKGYQCSDAKKCLTTAFCSGDVRMLLDEKRNCAPYRCQFGECLQSCTSTDDCILNHVCDPTGHECVPDPKTPTRRFGCEVRGVRPTSNRIAWAVIGLLLALRTTRRRRCAVRI